jgi:hypothetical protein
MKLIKGATIYEFTDLELAQEFANQANMPMQILLGDHPYYWVTTVNAAEQLASLGYEFLHIDHKPSISVTSSSGA